MPEKMYDTPFSYMPKKKRTAKKPKTRLAEKKGRKMRYRKKLMSMTRKSKFVQVKPHTRRFPN